MKRFIVLSVVLVVSVACDRRPAAPEHHYQLSGKVLAVNVHDRTATVSGAAIPGWMEAMTMEYPIRSRSDFDRLRVGSAIKGTVNVRSDGDYDLSNIHETGK